MSGVDFAKVLLGFPKNKNYPLYPQGLWIKMCG